MNYQLSAQDILHIWEHGSLRPSLAQARVMLATCFPALSAERYARMSIGRRDALLYTIHAHTFGPGLPCLAECPSCHERLEFTLDSSNLCILPEESWEVEEHTYEIEAEGYTLQVRVPTCADQEDLATRASVAAGRALLLHRCILSAQTAQGPVNASDLPPTIQAHLEETLHAYDPRAIVEIALRCDACTHQWQLALDIISYLWAEIAAQATRLLREVHTLARAYGWREEDILAMSATRRQIYLEMAGGS